MYYNKVTLGYLGTNGKETGESEAKDVGSTWAPLRGRLTTPGSTGKVLLRLYAPRGVTRQKYIWWQQLMPSSLSSSVCVCWWAGHVSQSRGSLYTLCSMIYDSLYHPGFGNNIINTISENRTIKKNKKTQGSSVLLFDVRGIALPVNGARTLCTFK